MVIIFFHKNDSREIDPGLLKEPKALGVAQGMYKELNAHLKLGGKT